MKRIVLALLVSAGFATAFAPGLAATTDATAHKARKAVPRNARPSAPRARKDVDAGVATTGDPRRDQALQTTERDRLTTRIADLKRRIAVGERSRSGAVAALATAERALADVNRQLDEIALRQRAAQEMVGALDRQRLGTEGQIALGQTAFARTMTAWSAGLDRDPLHAWLVGGDPNEGALIDGYLRYAARAQAGELDALHARVGDLQARRQRADDENRLLAEQASAQSATREALVGDQTARRQALDRLSQKLAEQRSTASALEADEQRLSRIVEQLQRVIRKQADEERARRQAAKRLADEQAAAEARRNKGRDTPRTKPPPAPIDTEADPGGGAFAQLRGQLRAPTRGTVTGRFGTARGSGGATWKGLFFRTDASAEVRAVAAGKVIFADDLRGFGNLLIVDHGNQYLSIYANNDVVLRRTGETVQAGELVARAGNSSGDDQTGLYFELRFRGRPFDPTPWIAGR